MTGRIQQIVLAIQTNGRQRGTRPLPAGLFLAGILGGVLALVTCANLLASGQIAPTVSPAEPERTRGLEAQRQAVSLLQEADAPDASVTVVADALRRLAAALDALGTAPGAGAAPEPAALLPAALRDDLRGAAERLRLVTRPPTAATRSALEAARQTHDVTSQALRPLLDRARSALEGEVALGLTFQGTYSQTRAPEPVYGGHATAMGPAPAPTPAHDGPAPASPVTFSEAVKLPTRTWAGGPTKDHILESAGNGLALIDYDGDGWLDIYLVTAAQLTPGRERIPHRNALYRNKGGWQFEDVSARAGVDKAAWGNGVCAGDADGDGHLDLYVTNWGPNFLFRNRGDGTFEDVAARAGVAAGGWSTGCAFFDADADGDLDLYVARYVDTTWDDLRRAQRTLVWRSGPHVMVGPAGLPGEADLFFENLGDGRFGDATTRRGLSDAAKAYGFGVVATDVDDDGHVDLFVANDSNPNFLYRNLGDGRFESVGLLAGVAVNGEARAQAGMGIDVGDADGDGRLDFLLTAFAHDRNTLYRNLGDGLFEDATVSAGLAAPTFVRMGWGVAFMDADLDGRDDLFVANGHIFADVGEYPQLGETFAQANQFLLNTGTQFRDVSATAGAGLEVAKVSRGLAVGDLDNDGDPDIVVSNMDDQPTVLENGQRTGHHWVGLRVSAPEGNRFAIGAKVIVVAGGRTHVREIRSGGSYLSQHDLRVLVGLGSHVGAVTVEVRMPGGDRWRWSDVASDRYHDLVLSQQTRVHRAEGAR
jgi:hypothetical protein